jgi:hypothetical protein
MPRRPSTRSHREPAPDQLDATPASEGSVPSRRSTRTGRSASASGTPNPESTTGIVGDASASVTRSGEDTRRRGWFWHWNNIVTQYAPLIGLKGVGLINSYTVWTDRREHSPHRGYAFPSQQSEADFYGEDRAELITINKILVALDLIEIRKEMVPRTDEQGRRWKVPHNLYRVKDHGDDFQLTTTDVMNVVRLAERDRAVYRYVRRMFSPKFSPIDAQNVWHGILEEVRQDPTWQLLAEKTARDESKASARSKAGHASRRANDPTAVFSLPNDGDNQESEPTVADSPNDSRTVAKQGEVKIPKTSVAKTNTGSTTSDDGSNKGSNPNGATSVAASNRDLATSVGRTNTMQYQSITTTTTDRGLEEAGRQNDRVVRIPPDSSRDEDLAIRSFEEANDRGTTPAERRLLRQLAEQFESTASDAGSSGWAWVGLAIDDAVAAGSSFVAPRRVREILARWQRDGLPEEYGSTCDKTGEALSQVVTRGVPTPPVTSHRLPVGLPEPGPGEVGAEPFVAPVFTIEHCGMTNRQLWSAVLAELQAAGRVGVADVATWLRDAAILEAGETDVVLGVPHDLARRRVEARFAGMIGGAIERVSGVRVDVQVVLYREWQAA